MNYRVSELPHLTFAQQQKALEQIISDEIGVEGITILTSLLDFFGRIAYNFKTYLFKAFKNFKRSELEAFAQSHAFSMRSMLNDRFIDFHDARVPVPDGMIATYPEVVNYVQAWSKTANIADVLDRAITYFRQYETLTADDYKRLSNETQHLAVEIAYIKKEALEKDLRRFFIASHTRDLKVASAVIGDHATLVQVHNSVLGFADDYRLAQQVIAKIDYIEAAVSQIVTQVQKTPRMDPTYLRAIHALVSTLAVQIDLFGALLDYDQRIEHNWCLALQAIIAKTR